MHIVILSDALPPDNTGGAGKVAWQLGVGLIAAGHRVTFITRTLGKSRQENRHGIRVHALHSQYADRWRAWLSLFNPQVVLPLNQLMRQLKPDVVNVHTVGEHLSYHSLVIGRFSGAATVFTSHDVMPFAYTKLTYHIDPNRPDQRDGWNYRLPFGYNWRQMRLRWNPARNLSIRHTMTYYVDERIAVSAELKKALEANHLPPFSVVHNGLDVQESDSVQEHTINTLRQRFGLEGRRVILFGGKLTHEKGGHQLLTALCRVREQVPNVALLVLSRSSEYLDEFVAAAPDLSSHIVLGGWLTGEELLAAFRLAHVVASPSICFDSFPTVNLEGMAAGAVPVTTCFGGAHEAVIDDETGFVVNPYDVETLADRLIRLLADESLRLRMAQAGRARLEQLFTLEHQVNATLDVYRRALAKRRHLDGGEKENSQS